MTEYLENGIIVPFDVRYSNLLDMNNVMKKLALRLVDLDEELTEGNEWWGRPKKRFNYLKHLLYNGM